MTAKNRTLRYVLLILISAQLSQLALAQNRAGEHWVATWASSQQQGRGAAGPPRGAAPAGAPAVAPAQPAAAPPQAPPVAPPPVGFNNQTVRMIVRSTIGGRQVRVQLSNAYGAAALDVGAAHVGILSKDSEIAANTDRALLFNGKPSVTIPPGAMMMSDPVDLAIPKLTDLAISVYVPGATGVPSGHSMALRTTYISKEGDATGQPSLAGGTTAQAWYWVSGVDVLAPAAAATIVALGDSITDGQTSTPNTNHSWPSLFAERLAANPATANIAIVNHGISGNRILSDGAGVSALARFDRDVLSVAGVQWVMIMEGINDINGLSRGNTTGGLSADGLIGAMKQMIERAHTHGIKVIGCTLTPFGSINDSGEAMRTALNTFIRTSGAFDAVVDFDAVIRDPNDPKQFRATYNNTDKLHPNDAGYKAMADSIDLKLFTKK